MFEKKQIAQSGNIGIIRMPKELIGQRVYVVTEDESIELQDLVSRSLMYRKVDRLEQKERDKELEEFKREVLYRVQCLENCVYGAKQKTDSK